MVLYISLCSLQENKVMNNNCFQKIMLMNSANIMSIMLKIQKEKNMIKSQHIKLYSNKKLIQVKIKRLFYKK